MRESVYEPNGPIETVRADVAIVGSGLAGLYAAYHLSRKLSCALFTKETLEVSSSSLAQGGIAAVTEQNDCFNYHFDDTIKAGAGLCDESAVHVIVEEGPGDIEQMLRLGARFDTDMSGHLLTTREGGHGMSRILHAGGDATGQEMVRALKQTILRTPGVTVHENTFVADIVMDDGRAAGLLVYDQGRWVYCAARHVIIASGGIGQIYRYTTNPSVATGDGMAMALRAGAELKDMEFVQFHPTGLYTPANRNRQCFLISEAVRGEGGILLNDAGERFMEGVHPMRELAPRDVVAREIYRQIQHQKSPYVRLDITHRSREFLRERFPTIYARCMESGIDIATEPIPVGPVQHYMMGGIRTDLWGASNIPGLYACGEAACTGVHGANRLASNSTLECLVFGRRCATHINERADDSPPRAKLPDYPRRKPVVLDIERERNEVKGIMVKYCGIIRRGDAMRRGLHHVNGLLGRLEDAALTTVHAMELYNMAQVAGQILSAALARKRSVGSHYRTDEGEDCDV
jgi:L-aspartate oxidase